jgi:alanyl-tRNA synthetase
VAIEKLVAQRSELEKQIRRLQAGAASQGELATADVEGVPVVTGRVDGLDGEGLAAVSDREAARRGSAVIVLGAVTDGKVVFVAKVSPDLVARKLHAGNLVREIARLAGGGGGGRPDFAQAGGRTPEKIDPALAAAPDIVRAQLGR